MSHKTMTIESVSAMHPHIFTDETVLNMAEQGLIKTKRTQGQDIIVDCGEDGTVEVRMTFAGAKITDENGENRHKNIPFKNEFKREFEEFAMNFYRSVGALVDPVDGIVKEITGKTPAEIRGEKAMVKVIDEADVAEAQLAESEAFQEIETAQAVEETKPEVPSEFAVEPNKTAKEEVSYNF